MHQTFICTFSMYFFYFLNCLHQQTTKTEHHKVIPQIQSTKFQCQMLFLNSANKLAPVFSFDTYIYSRAWYHKSNPWCSLMLNAFHLNIFLVYFVFSGYWSLFAPFVEFHLAGILCTCTQAAWLSWYLWRILHFPRRTFLHWWS